MKHEIEKPNPNFIIVLVQILNAMKTKFGLILLFVCTAMSLHAQTNKTTIPYDLQRTFVAPSNGVGGDLVITEEETPIPVPTCETQSDVFQTIYSGKMLTTVFLNVDNTLGAGCVTIEVRSGNVLTKKTIPAGSISGVLSFSKATSITVSINLKTNQTFPETVTAKGSVDFWF